MGGLVEGMCFDTARGAVCSKAVKVEDRCVAYLKPEAWHRMGGCPLSSIRILETESKKKVNPLKASKRAKKGNV